MLRLRAERSVDLHCYGGDFKTDSERAMSSDEKDLAIKRREERKEEKERKGRKGTSLKLFLVETRVTRTPPQGGGRPRCSSGIKI